MGEILVASPEAVDAYKTYLYRQGHTALANSIHPGELIPTYQIEQHINVTIASITILKEFGMSRGAEEAKLAGLKKLLEGVAGKRTPSKEEEALKAKEAALLKKLNADALAAMKAVNNSKTVKAIELAKAQAAALWEKYNPDPDAKADAKAKAAASDLMDKFGNTIADPQKIIGSYFNKQFVQNLKAQTPLGNKNPILMVKPGTMVPVEKKGGLASIAALQVGRSKIEQEFIMRIGMVSDMNVVIEQYRSTGWDTVRLLCKRCSAVHVFSDAAFLAGATQLTDEAEKFCKAHRHEAPKPVVEAPVGGRKFREDD